MKKTYSQLRSPLTYIVGPGVGTKTRPLLHLQTYLVDLGHVHGTFGQWSILLQQGLELSGLCHDPRAMAYITGYTTKKLDI